MRQMIGKEYKEEYKEEYEEKYKCNSTKWHISSYMHEEYEGKAGEG
jgi:hypothetical protein